MSNAYYAPQFQPPGRFGPWVHRGRKSSPKVFDLNFASIILLSDLKKENCILKAFISQFQFDSLIV